MAKEQQHTIQSPLAELVKPGAMRQETLTGLERFMPCDTSRFSIKRIAFTLRRGADAIKAVMSRDGIRGHMSRTEHHASGSSSALYWSEGENKKIVASAELPGDVTMTTGNGSLVFTSETGATIKYHASGAFVFSPAPLKQERLAQEQTGLPWWQKDREVIENEYIYEAGSVIAEPVFGESAKKGTPYKYFKLLVPVSETETYEADVYVYGQVISLVNRRNLRAGDIVRVRASVQFHEQRQTQGRSIFVPWLRLFDVQKIK